MLWVGWTTCVCWGLCLYCEGCLCWFKNKICVPSMLRSIAQMDGIVHPFLFCNTHTSLVGPTKSQVGGGEEPRIIGTEKTQKRQTKSKESESTQPPKAPQPQSGEGTVPPSSPPKETDKPPPEKSREEEQPAEKKAVVPIKVADPAP
eukprot:GHVQ01009189.1.p1 GENE.GHVQ01009189.1~~GHVQ01009189.1.p1  ORF type:complete len:147 (+),score=35.18 GHVQ01009189.1:413-853(+)